MIATLSMGIDDYQYNTSSEKKEIESYKLDFNINQKYLRAHFNYYLNSRHSIDFGWNSIYYSVNPGSYQPASAGSIVKPDVVSRDQALESAIYLNDKFDITTALSVEAGVRYSIFNYMGPKILNVYAPGLPKTEDNIIGIATYSKGKFIKTYGGPEYRLSV